MIHAAPLTLYISGIGICGSGLPNWTVTQKILKQEQSYEACDPEFGVITELPPAERRRVGTLVKLSFAAGREAIVHAKADSSKLLNVFTSSSGDGDNCNQIFGTLAGLDRQISPTRFHNSVHNAAAGYWSIAQSNMSASTSLCAFDGSFCAGLLEAACLTNFEKKATLLVSYDCPYPEPLQGVRRIQGLVGVAIVLDSALSPATQYAMQISLAPTEQSALKFTHPVAEIESLIQHNPTGRSLALLNLLAHPYDAENDSISLPYLDDCQLVVKRLPVKLIDELDFTTLCVN